MHAEIISFPPSSKGIEAFKLLEAALIEYAVRYGLTDKARAALSGFEPVMDLDSAQDGPSLSAFAFPAKREKSLRPPRGQIVHPSEQ